MKILVLNSPEDARRIYGSALFHDDVTSTYVDGGNINPKMLLDKETPDLVLLSLEWLPFQRVVSAEARRRNIPVLYVMDGILEWSYVWNNHSFVFPAGTVLQPLIASHISVIGRHPARILAAMGLGEKISIIGLPRLDNFDRARVVASGAPPRLLICCARTPSHNNEHRISVIQALSDIKAIAEELGIGCAWRITDELAQILDVKKAAEPLTELLSTSSALITLPSTVALEGMLCGLPTAIMEYRPVPLYLETAWQIRSREHIRPTINELLYPPAEKLAYQDYCLNEELNIADAGDNLHRLIAEITAHTGKVVESAPKAPYGALDFKLVHSQISTFSSSSLASLQYEIDAYASYDKLLRTWKADLFATWPIKLLRMLRGVPLFKRINRLLESI
ncbi:hypothetical protein [Frateuria terrea]|uniref:Uncharacterized protein n=1 Tax=Frateuria terrea TaxID=529704 RepID=A0A1H6XQD8_9GAMM|nr:hypothetical protein [Frateuria terrea]SEJ31269.1 hypothetical protein SAMN04487997_2951 [Frateuria terrea]SFP52242.1 hypothetical protein SAMN02927913_2490 [Frateuria terrea]